MMAITMKNQEQLIPNAIGNSVNLGGKYPDDIITPFHYKKCWTYLGQIPILFAISWKY